MKFRYPSTMERLIFHIDVNSAFLSWEAARRVQNGQEDLRLIPSCIGGDPQKRTGIVLAKSLPAKKYGVTTGEPMSMALRKCPVLVSAPPDFKLYSKCSKAFKAICQEYTPTMESFSIDEVFLDMTGMERIYPDPIALAHTIKDRIKNELGFTVNVGIGRNKLCAKMASDFEKPDRVHTLFPEEIPEKMWPLPVRELLFCGKSSAEKLVKNQIKTIGDLAKSDVTVLQGILGEKAGASLWQSANGIDDSPVCDEPEDAKGYSVESTVEENLESLPDINKMLLAQADVVAARMRAEDAKAYCIAVHFRTINFVNRSHQKKLENSTNITAEIYQVATELIAEAWNHEPLRLIGLAASDIDRGGFEQMSLFGDEKKDKLKKLDTAIDSIRDRYGNASVKRASVMDVDKRIARKYKGQKDNELEN